MHIQCKTMTVDHMVAVMEIENEYNPSPWKKSHFETSLQHHRCWVLEKDQRTIGYAILSIFKDEGEILNIAIHSQCRRQGLGEYLLNYIIHYAKEQKVKTLFLEVRQSNEKAQHLYNKLGFHLIGSRAGYYASPPHAREDALLFAKEI